MVYNQFINSNNLHYKLIFSYVSFCPKIILCGMTYIGGEEQNYWIFLITFLWNYMLDVDWWS